MWFLKKFFVFALLLTTLFCLTGCGSKTPETAELKEIPTMSIAYGNDLHCCMLNVAMIDTEAFADKAMRINPLSDSQFELLKDDEVIAKFNIIRGKTGAECATMMAQGHLDICLCSNTAIQCAYDVGTEVKILSPLHVGGVAIVMAPEVGFYGFDALKEHIDNLERPFKVGYPSAISGPRIVTEYVLKDSGFKVTEDPGDVTADVLMVDLKGFQNVTSSINSGAVDAWLGTSPFQENSVAQGMGKIVLKLDDYPPAGKWSSFPCCVLAATTDAINEYPEAIEGVVSVIADCIDYANTNWDNFAEINSPIIGFEEEVILASDGIIYTSDPSEAWVDGIEIYFNTIKSLGKFSDRLKDADYDTVKTELFDFSFLENIKSR
jgi:NitT/TauT family transport system substrate-binding protein